jgi:hypothetical protein
MRILNIFLLNANMQRGFFEFIRENYIEKKDLNNSLVLLKFKRNVTEKD